MPVTKGSILELESFMFLESNSALICIINYNLQLSQSACVFGVFSTLHMRFGDTYSIIGTGCGRVKAFSQCIYLPSTLSFFEYKGQIIS